MAFGAGAAGYFLPLDEPPLSLFVLLGLAAFAAFLAARRRWLGGFAAALAVLAAAGFIHAGLMTWLADHPVLAYARTATVKGQVVAVQERGPRGLRLLMRPLVIDPPPREGLPPRLRVTLRARAPLPRPGDGLTARARLMPPPLSALPGGYDFARLAWFSGIGATGFVLGRAEVWREAPPPDFALALQAAIAGLRLDVARRVRQVLPGDAGGIAAALIVGERGGIAPAAAEAMRTAGLSHILSISGLHMSLVAGGLFAALRLLFALIRPLALDWPAKKIAAVLALAGTLAYFLISGMDVPAGRSTLMVAVMLLAVLVDRRALSMRVIAVAALATLLLSPQAVMDPGAQMSFAAVLALLAGLEAYAGRPAALADGGDVSPLVRLLGRVARWLGAALATTFLAGLATAPIALYHFGRLSPLGLVANLLAAPLVSFLIMPAAMVSALAMPFGLDRLPLAVMGFGIDRMLDIAAALAEWTPGGGLVGRPPGWAMLAVAAGGLWICLWTGRKRWLGSAAVALGITAALLAAPPALIVAGDGRMALVRDGAAVRLVGKGDAFTTAVLLAALGLDPADRRQVAVLGEGVSCDDDACLLRAADGSPRLAVVTGPMAFGEECAETPQLVSPLAAPPWCRPAQLLIDAPALAASGARLYRTAAAAASPVEVGRVLGARPRRWQAAAAAGRRR